MQMSMAMQEHINSESVGFINGHTAIPLGLRNKFSTCFTHDFINTIPGPVSALMNALHCCHMTAYWIIA